MANLTEIILEAIENVHDMDVTLEDYATAAAEAVKGAIKPLVWKVEPDIADCMFSDLYSIERRENGKYWLRFRERLIAEGSNSDAAKAAANAHHVASTLSAMGVEG